MRAPVAAAIADTFVVKHERAAVTGWLGRIKTIVLMHRDVISARQLASPVVVAANAVRVSCVERLNQILAHQVSAIVGAAEALQRTILQDDRLEFRKNRLTQSARRGPAHHIADRNGGHRGESDEDKRDADSMSSHEDVDLAKDKDVAFRSDVHVDASGLETIWTIRPEHFDPELGVILANAGHRRSHIEQGFKVALQATLEYSGVASMPLSIRRPRPPIAM